MDCIINLYFTFSLYASCARVYIKFYTVAIWPVTGKGFQNTKWPAACIFNKFDLSKNPNQSKLSYVD